MVQMLVIWLVKLYSGLMQWMHSFTIVGEGQWSMISQTVKTFSVENTMKGCKLVEGGMINRIFKRGIVWIMNLVSERIGNALQHKKINTPRPKLLT